MSDLPPFQPPATMLEAKARKVELVANIQAIDAQLSNRDRHNANGSEMTNTDWHRWRSSAVVARRYLLADLQQLKLWITARGTEEHEAQQADRRATPAQVRYRRCPYCYEKVAVGITEGGEIGRLLVIDAAELPA